MPIHHHRTIVAIGILIAAVWCAPAFAGPLDTPVAVSLPAQALGDSLRALAREANLQILFDAGLVSGRSAGPISSTLAPRAALEELLRGTDLEAQEQTPGVVVIRHRKDSPAKPQGAVAPSGGVTATGTRDDGELGEIIVTAQRREERLQEVPISVSAFSQQLLDQQGLRNMDDLTRLTPGVTFQRNGMGTSGNYNDEFSDINIRGIDSTAGTATTGIYIDDTPIQGRHIGYGGIAAFPALFDLDRVEVLRGPQGTLFGAGAEGGVVRFISPQPSLTQDSGYMRTEVATTKNGDPSYELGAAASGVIIDDVLAFRVSASFRRDGGWVDRVGYTLTPNEQNPTLPTPVFDRVIEPNSNWQQTTTVRAALKWAVDDSLSITPSIYYQELHINDTAAYWENLSNPGADQFYNGNALANSSTDPFLLAAVKVDWNLGFAELTSSSSFFSRHQSGTSNYTNYDREIYAAFALLPSIYPQPGDAGYALFQDNQKNFYQEIRLASSDPGAKVVWNAGVFYSHQNENIPESAYDPTLESEILSYSTQQGYPYDLCAAPFPCPNGNTFNNPVDQVIETQAAFFGEAAVKLTDTVKATVGVRVSRDRYTGSVIEGGASLGANFNQQSSATETPVTPKFVLSWQPDHDNLYYASASKGYRVGGTNVPVSTLCGGDLANAGIAGGQVPGTYSSDSLWSYEVGGKNIFLDHRLEINSSLFLINWSNIQQFVYLPTCGYSFTANLGKVQSRGGDIDIRFRPVDTLTLGASVAYTDARFTESSCAGDLRFTGTGLGCNGASAPSTGIAPVVSAEDRLVGAPWSVMISAERTFAAWAGRMPYVRLDYQFTTAQTALLPYHDDRNANFDATLPGLPQTKNLQLRGGFRWAGYDVSIFAQNVLNQNPALMTARDVASPPNADNLYYARGQRPLSIGVTATYRY
jgi:outer membrane receptor protein involved in Fe transport